MGAWTGLLRNRPLFDKVEALFLVTAVFGFLLTLLSVVRTVRLPFQMDCGEVPFLGLAARVARGLSAYPSATEVPYIINNPYGPVAVYHVALAVKIFGVSFTMPRILVAVSGAWCTVLIALLIRHWGGAPRERKLSDLQRVPVCWEGWPSCGPSGKPKAGMRSTRFGRARLILTVCELYITGHVLQPPTTTF